MQQQREYGGRAGPAQHRRGDRHRPQRGGRVDHEQHRPAGHRRRRRDASRWSRQNAASSEELSSRRSGGAAARPAWPGPAGPTAARWSATEPVSSGRPAGGQVDHHLGAGRPRRCATARAAARRRQRPRRGRRVAGRTAPRRSRATPGRRRTPACGRRRAASSAGIRPRDAERAAGPHLARLEQVHLAAQQAGDRRDRLRRRARRRAPSGRPPRHTEQRPHGSAAGSSRDSCSSSIRHRSPRT